jgi:site-specific DNA-methyltransferase (adenine-specific)
MQTVRQELADPIELSTSTILTGDAATVLRSLPDESFQSCITSPPYWGLRDYESADQIGDEADPDQYVARLVDVFNEVHRVLSADGTLWLNLGDSYTSGNRAYRAPDRKNPVRAMAYRAPTPSGLKPKDLVGIPWRVAFGLQQAGWHLRSDIVWEKTNCMPESVKDRPTRSHEYIFLLTKSLRYHYNYENILEPGGRNRRTVWSVATEPFSGAHFATFPPALIEPCILAGSAPGDWVLDPFFGAGTVGVVAEQQHRRYVGIELNPEYVALAQERIRNLDRPLFTSDVETGT